MYIAHIKRSIDYSTDEYAYVLKFQQDNKFPDFSRAAAYSSARYSAASEACDEVFNSCERATKNCQSCICLPHIEGLDILTKEARHSAAYAVLSITEAGKMYGKSRSAILRDINTGFLPPAACRTFDGDNWIITKKALRDAYGKPQC